MPRKKNAVPWYFSLRMKKESVRRGVMRSVIPQSSRRLAIDRQARSKNKVSPRRKKRREAARKPAPNSTDCGGLVRRDWGGGVGRRTLGVGEPHCICAAVSSVTGKGSICIES